MKSLILIATLFVTSTAFSLGIPAPKFNQPKFPKKQEQVKAKKQVKNVKVVKVASK